MTVPRSVNTFTCSKDDVFGENDKWSNLKVYSTLCSAIKLVENNSF